jgi:hypothetical protein
MSQKQDDIISGFVVPIAQATTTGSLAGGAAWAAAVTWRWSEPIAWAVIVFAVVTFIAWAVYRGEWRRAVDVVLGVIPPIDPAPAEVYQQEVVKIQVISQDPGGAFAAGIWADLPLTLELATQAARRVVATGAFSHASLAGPGRPLTRSQFETLRDEFIARGLAVWNNPGAHSQGVTLTAAGRATIKRLATITPPQAEGGQRLTKI